ncbi:MAG TPA: SGNH/GDSL hydrolase family protein [Terracidiphilus sp.]
MEQRKKSLVRLTSSLLALLLALSSTIAKAERPGSIPEEIEWTWEVRPPHADPNLPNVLLLGDSISRNYFPEVTKDLTGIANVYLMASSTCVGDPRLPRQITEFANLEHVRFRIVHFNNGMHGWDYSEAAYKAAFPAFLHAVHSLADKDGALIWASTTPVRNGASTGASNFRIEKRNAIALAIVKPEGVLIDDQYALMLQHGDLHEDDVHFNPDGARIQGNHAAGIIRSTISARH